MKSLIAPFDAYKGTDPYVFISYAHKNSEAVFRHITRLRDEGFRIWYDEGIDPGTDWSDEIAAALNGAAAFLVFISPESVESHNVKKEIVFALSKRKHMIAVHIAETELPLGLQMQLGNIQAILEDRFNDREKFYERLINALPRETRGDLIVDPPPPPPPPPPPLDGRPPVADISAFQVLNFKVLQKYLGQDVAITLPSRFDRIFSMAFSNCAHIQVVYVPPTVKELDLAAFEYCENLHTLAIEGEHVRIAAPNFSGCPQLTITCHRGSYTHEQLKAVYTGKLAFFEDAQEHKPTVQPPPAVTSEPAAPPSFALPANTAAFEPRGTATITLRDGTTCRAVANTLVFSEGYFTMMGLGVDIKSSNAEVEVFNGMREFSCKYSFTGELTAFNVLDFDNEKTQIEVHKPNCTLWYINPENEREYVRAPLSTIVRVQFDWRQTPGYLSKFSLIQRSKYPSLLVPYASVTFLETVYGASLSCRYLTQVPLQNEGAIPLKQLQSIEITRVISEPQMMMNRGYELEMRISKKNGETVNGVLKGNYALCALDNSGFHGIALQDVERVILDMKQET